MSTTKHTPTEGKKTFEELARELECDEDEVRFEEAVKRVARVRHPRPDDDSARADEERSPKDKPDLG